MSCSTLRESRYQSRTDKELTSQVHIAFLDSDKEANNFRCWTQEARAVFYVIALTKLIASRGFFVFMVNVRREKARESCVTNLKMSRNVSVNR